VDSIIAVVENAMVRATTPDDLPRIAEIYAHYVVETVITFDEEPLTIAQWQARLTDLTARRFPFLVATVHDHVVGYAYATPWKPKPAYRHTAENSIYLDPAWTGRGLGRTLLSALLAESAGSGIRQLIAVISDTGDNTSAALHGSFGFKETGRLTAVGHKHGRWIDTVLMQRDLTRFG
jgi:L-amino acid N-acyltransferase YncA